MMTTEKIDLTNMVVVHHGPTPIAKLIEVAKEGLGKVRRKNIKLTDDLRIWTREERTEIIKGVSMTFVEIGKPDCKVSSYVLVDKAVMA